MPARLTARAAAEHGYACAIASGHPPSWGPGARDETSASWPHALIDAVAKRTDPDEIRAHIAELEQVLERDHIARISIRFLRAVSLRSRPPK
jgi:hypothetical protein